VVTQQNIGSTNCSHGYTETIRPPEAQTEAFKYNVAYVAYGTPQTEYPPSPNPKDSVEDALNSAVWSGRVPLAAAQQAIATDWMTAESVLGITGQ
jgi:hypothetical protein